MTQTQHFVSKKQIDGVVYYRIHDILNNELTNIRCVSEQKNGKKRIINDSRFIPGLSDFLHDTGDIVAIEGAKAQSVLAFLAEHDEKVEHNFRIMMDAMDNGGYLQAVAALGGELFAFVTERSDTKVVRMYHLIGGETGKVAYFGAINPDIHFPRVIDYLLNEETDDKVYQTGDGEFFGIRSMSDSKIALTVHHESEGDRNYFVGNQQAIRRYIKKSGREWEKAREETLTLTDVQPVLDGILGTLQEAFGFTVL